MKYNKLGKTGIEVSELCFGALTIGPLQSNKDFEEGGQLISYAIERGINFIDTAELYNTYGHIRKGLVNSFKDIIIASKSYDYTNIGAERSLLRALNGINREYIDIFLLHEQESIHTIKGHWDALEFYIKEKQKGTIRAVGISTHRIEAVYAASDLNEIDVIHPLINLNGLGIEDGTRQDMEKALKYAKKMGKGIYGMKPLGGGNFINNVDECLKYIMNLDELHSFAIGMQSKAEVDFNINFVEGNVIKESLRNKLKNQKRKLRIDDWCTGCGNCIKKCNQKALFSYEGKIEVKHDKCLLCGYCSAYCPEFCIKII